MWDKAVCSICGYYITWLNRRKEPAGQAADTTSQKISKQHPAVTRALNTMAQGYYGSICLEDLFTGKIATGSNGKKYVCIDDLNASPFNVGKNGKHYAGIGVWVNDDIDQFGNIAGISLTQSQQEREQQAKKVYVGNLRRSGGVQTAASPVQQPVAANPQQAALNDLPF